MNKTITFNLNGLVFTIEETGYDQLRNYLEAVNKALELLPDGRDILMEVEARIAEKFKLWLQSDDRMVLTEADVQRMQADMGSAEQFSEWAGESGDASETPQDQAPRSLFRTRNSRLLGGVASGLAAHLGLDVVVIRLLFGLSVLFFAGYGLVIYFILWVSLPVIDQEPFAENRFERSSRMYRDTERRVFGGVASGLAAYLRIDPVVVRIMLIMALFWGGFGLLAYLVLWIAMPAAKTLSQKVEMKGEKPNLTNLRKAGQQGAGYFVEQQSLARRLFQLPFVLLRALVDGMLHALRAAAGILRIGVGALVLLVSIPALFAFGAVLVAVFGLYFGAIPAELPFPVQNITGSEGSDLAAMFFTSIFLVVPVLLGLYFGIRLLFNRKIFNRRTILVGSVVWGVTGLALFVIGLRIAVQFQTEGSYTHQHVSLPVSGVLYVNTTKFNQNGKIVNAKLRIRSQGDSLLTIREFVKSHGKNEAEAVVWASMTRYGIKRENDSTLLLNRHLEFLPGARFRGQEGYFELCVPEGQLLILSKSVVNMLSRVHDCSEFKQHPRNQYEVRVIGGQLECLNCRESI
jgi:phage shock protein PspC (stress-responsive transcriptional regulator)